MAILRLTRGRRWSERFVSYKITVDGVLAGKLRNGAELEIPVSVGEHTVRASWWWTGSPETVIDVPAGQETVLAVSINDTGWFSDYSRSRHLRLRRVVQPTPGPCSVRLESYGKTWTSVVPVARGFGWYVGVHETMHPEFPILIVQDVDESFAQHVCAEIRQAGGQASIITS